VLKVGVWGRDPQGKKTDAGKEKGRVGDCSDRIVITTGFQKERGKNRP